MKKILIGSLVGGIILFLWSFLAWTMLPLHVHTFKYTPAQDSILKVLADSKLGTGVYAMPMADNRNVSSGMDSKYRQEGEAVMKANAGKPAATIYYKKGGFNMGAMTIVRGFLYNFLAVLAACILLAPAFATMNSFFGRWWLTLVAGLLICATGPLIYHNWMGFPRGFAMDMIVDTFLNWGITGLWLAYYFGRK